MNEFNNLKPEDSALRLFFKEDTLYGPQLPLENPAIPLFEGGKNADLLMIFSHNKGTVLADDWGTMVSGLIQNERAMNLKLDEVCLLNLHQNPDMTLESLFAAFPAKNVLVWGKTGVEELDAIPALESGTPFGKKVFKLNEATSYLSKEAKGELWQFIKSHLLA